LFEFLLLKRSKNKNSNKCPSSILLFFSIKIIEVIVILPFLTLAKNRIYLNEYQTINDLTTDVDDYIDFYNHRRFHETLDYKKPMDVYQESIKLNQNKKKAS